MSEEEQIERMKRNQERLANRKKPPMPTPSVQTQSSESREEAPFPLRVTRVVTAVLPSSLVARRVSVEDPPPELDTPLPEQMPLEVQQKSADQSKKLLNKPPRRMLMEAPDQNWPSAEMAQDQPAKRINEAHQDLERHETNLYTIRQQHQTKSRSSKENPCLGASKADPTETSRTRAGDQPGLGNGHVTSEVMAEERPTALLTPDLDPDLCLTPEQREAKLRRVERIRERVIRSQRECHYSQSPAIQERGAGNPPGAP
ncbi:uncharacterized protein LOC115378042 [Myripristis murdjan]|uniref:uncharacterized protein LOC115378042 n=1 Tax=Myripristis murdjan TaxID=586833 RepID=UPI0011761CAB|nr:uncharacterized protein LOC115378042 [Myripristis murdjan]